MRNVAFFIIIDDIMIKAQKNGTDRDNTYKINVFCDLMKVDYVGKALFRHGRCAR